MRLWAALILWPGLAAAQDAIGDFVFDNPRATAILEAAEAACLKETEVAGLTINPDLAITETDLDGDQGEGPSGGPDDMVVDFNYISCLGGNIWAGTGGAPVHFVLDGATSAAWSGANWQTVRFGDSLPVLILLGRHGTYCDGYGAQPCVSAIAVADGAFSVVVEPGPIGDQ